MTHHQFDWFSIPPSQLPEALFARSSAAMDGNRMGEPEQSLAGTYAVGFPKNRTENGAAITIVRESEAAQLLAWVSTYAPECFPISQTSRVLGFDDWELAKKIKTERVYPGKDAIWPSVVLGEMLAQGDADFQVRNLPMSRAYACFSFTQARASMLYGSQAPAMASTVQRLRLVSRSGLFVKRLLPVDDLAPIWSFVDDQLPKAREISGVVRFVMAALDGNGSIGKLEVPSDYSRVALKIAEISSGSLEQRVIEFERAVIALQALAATDSTTHRLMPLHLAAFAVWVGSGSSHISLLDEFKARYPGSYAWFGLLAGLAGPKHWDREWIRASNSIERLLRASFSLQESPNFDLCWEEYRFIEGQREPVAWLKDLPKLYPKLLSVEIVPGATCQMRLDEPASPSGRKVTATQAEPAAEELQRIMESERRQHAQVVAEVERTLNVALSSLKNLRQGQLELIPASAPPEPSGKTERKPPAQSSKRNTTPKRATPKRTT
ncbi:hypothetical protein [Caballeronia sp. LjRoot31]|jgi:hypothetical protein|uniref:hypothetical protein n=1 Tax=Caballeronia sp. LjRoot31 TaxID=3342324 RepID=UPI003ECC73C1